MESYVGQIKMFAGNYAPVYWALCNGQYTAISQNEALFSLLSNVYGGDGITTFALPDMRGRIPLHYGTGPGLTPRSIGLRFGAETVTLTEAQIPPHHHPMQASLAQADTTSPAGAMLAITAQNFYTADTTPTVNFGADEVSSTGGNQYHTNMMPTLCLNFIICLQGVYPPRD